MLTDLTPQLATHGVDVDDDEFRQTLAVEYVSCVGVSVSTLLDRPEEAAAFCDGLRSKHSWPALSDAFLLDALAELDDDGQFEGLPKRRKLQSNFVSPR